MSKKRFHTSIYHILAWTTFIGYETSVLLIASIVPNDSNVWMYISSYTIGILLFYTNAHLILNYISKHKKTYLLFVPLFLIEMSVYTFLAIGVRYIQTIHFFPNEPFPITESLIVRHVWRGIYFVMLSSAYWFALTAIRNQKRIAQLEIQKLKSDKEKSELEKNLMRSQNAYLQAQINPHLLFNTLNFIYNSVQHVSKKASEGIILLSEVMRNALSGVQEDGKIELGKEIEHINKYIALNQLRFGNRLYLDVQIQEGIRNERIPPLILLTFIENVFQHGDLSDPEHPASISICCNGDHQLHLAIRNKKRKSYIKRGHGIGVKNAETRLQSHYDKKHYDIAMKNNNDHFSVDLKIKLS